MNKSRSVRIWDCMQCESRNPDTEKVCPKCAQQKPPKDYLTLQAGLNLGDWRCDCGILNYAFYNYHVCRKCKRNRHMDKII